jgi:hypothetical protein
MAHLVDNVNSREKTEDAPTEIASPVGDRPTREQSPCLLSICGNNGKKRMVSLSRIGFERKSSCKSRILIGTGNA